MEGEDWRDRFRDWDQPDPAYGTCGECANCRVPQRGVATDPGIGYCTDSGEFVRREWKADGECDSFVPR